MFLVAEIGPKKSCIYLTAGGFFSRFYAPAMNPIKIERDGRNDATEQKKIWSRPLFSIFSLPINHCWHLFIQMRKRDKRFL